MPLRAPSWMALTAAIACTACLEDLQASADDAALGPAADAADPGAAPADDAVAAPDPDPGIAPPPSCGDGVPAAPGLVTTAVGPIQGARTDNGVWRFLGVPFAQPPVGELRWAPPKATGCLSQQPFVADAFGPACPQLEDGVGIGDEDCLHLNIWAPEGALDDDVGRPVVFFIHGGANIQGSASQRVGPDQLLYSGEHLAEREDVVVVTAQYRLGPLGFLALPELSAESGRGSGHYAHLDLIAALEWVQAHIDRFGGDPSRVLVAGQSAGGVNTCTLFASPLARGLFSAAAMLSGFCMHQPLADAEAQHGRVVDLLSGCKDAPDRLACLRALPADQLIETLPGTVNVGLGMAAFPGATTMYYEPVVGGDLLPEPPLALIERGEHADVPLVLGTTADELGNEAIFPVSVSNEWEYRGFLNQAVGSAGVEDMDAVFAIYPAADFDTPNDAFIRALTDFIFTRKARELARVAAAGGEASVYRYLFSHRPATHDGEAHDGTLPAGHGLDVRYLFNAFAAVPGLAPTAADQALADGMMAAWAALARTGDPNTPALGAEWPVYDVARDPYLDLAAPVSAGQGVRTDACDMWDAVTP